MQSRVILLLGSLFLSSAGIACDKDDDKNEDTNAAEGNGNDDGANGDGGGKPSKSDCQAFCEKAFDCSNGTLPVDTCAAACESSLSAECVSCGLESECGDDCTDVCTVPTGEDAGADEAGAEEAGEDDNEDNAGDESSTEDNGQPGDACNCDPSPEATAGVYKICAGTEDGCEGVGATSEMFCIAEGKSGEGTCAYLCSEEQSGMACEDGRGTCTASASDGVGSWYTCE